MPHDVGIFTNLGHGTDGDKHDPPCYARVTMGLEAILLIGYSVGVPLLVFVFLQLVREWQGIWHSGGADVIGLLIVFDASVIYAPNAFTAIVQTQAFHVRLQETAGLSVLVGIVLALITILYGERALMRAHYARGIFGSLPKRRIVIIWGCTVSYVAAHLLFFLGDW